MTNRYRLSAFAALAALAAGAALPGPLAGSADAAQETDAGGAVAREGPDKPDRARTWMQSLHPTPACPLPRTRPRELLVAFGTYEGDSVASTAVGGLDQETNLVDVVIEPGRRPLYLILTSYESMVWRLSGATARVRQVVVSSQQTAERAQGSEAGAGPRL